MAYLFFLLKRDELTDSVCECMCESEYYFELQLFQMHPLTKSSRSERNAAKGEVYAC